MCLIGIGWEEGVRQLRDNKGGAMEVDQEHRVWNQWAYGYFGKCLVDEKVLVKFVIGRGSVQLNKGRMLRDGGIVITSCLCSDDVIIINKVQHWTLDGTPVVRRLEWLRLRLKMWSHPSIIKKHIFDINRWFFKNVFGVTLSVASSPASTRIASSTNFSRFRSVTLNNWISDWVTKLYARFAMVLKHRYFKFTPYRIIFALTLKLINGDVELVSQILHELSHRDSAVIFIHIDPHPCLSRESKPFLVLVTHILRCWSKRDYDHLSITLDNEGNQSMSNLFMDGISNSKQSHSKTTSSSHPIKETKHTVVLRTRLWRVRHFRSFDRSSAASSDSQQQSEYSFLSNKYDILFTESCAYM